VATPPGGDTRRLDEALSAWRLSGGDHAGAEALDAVVNELLDQHELSSDALSLLGQSLFYLERDHEAIGVLERALVLDPKQPVALRFRGLVAMYGNELEEAESYLAGALRVAPAHPPTLSDHARVLELLGRPEEALAALELATDLEPDRVEAHARLGAIHAEMGRHEEAVKHLEVAAAVTTEDPDLLYNLGQSRQLLGDDVGALEAFLETLRITPDDPQAIAKAIQQYQALGRVELRDEARDHLFELRRQGKDSQLFERGFYCREQFRVGEHRVMALEHFELLGEWAKRYEFFVSLEGVAPEEYTISLGSYDFTNSFLRESGKVSEGERAFHLDGYYSDGAHATFYFFGAEPSYEEVRELVVQVIEGTLEAFSSTTPSAASDR